MKCGLSLSLLLSAVKQYGIPRNEQEVCLSFIRIKHDATETVWGLLLTDAKLTRGWHPSRWLLGAAKLGLDFSVLFSLNRTYCIRCWVEVSFSLNGNGTKLGLRWAQITFPFGFSLAERKI